MASTLIGLVVLLCVVQFCLAAVAREHAPVTDPRLKEQGYSCQNENIGPMKDGEENDNYDPTQCERVSCSNSFFIYASCGTYSVEPNIKVIPEDPTKPYPECCAHLDR